MKILMTLLLGVSFLFATVDLNHASKKQLMSLKGIGNKKAVAILEYRKKHCFKNVKDIVKIKGLGKKFLEHNRKNLQVRKCKK